MRHTHDEDIQHAINRAFYQGLIRGSVQKEVLLLAQSTGLLPQDLAPWLENGGDGSPGGETLGRPQRVQHLRLEAGKGTNGHATEERNSGSQPTVPGTSSGSAKSRTGKAAAAKEVTRAHSWGGTKRENQIEMAVRLSKRDEKSPQIQKQIAGLLRNAGITQTQFKGILKLRAKGKVQKSVTKSKPKSPEQMAKQKIYAARSLARKKNEPLPPLPGEVTAA